MKNSILFLFMLFFVGCAAMGVDRTIRMNMTFKDMSKAESQVIVDATYEGAGRLYACDYFRYEHPKEFALFFRQITSEYVIVIQNGVAGQVEALEVERGHRIAAYALPVQKLIVIKPAYLHCQKCDLKRTMAHELLHLAQMSNHGSPMKDTDIILVTLNKCGFKGY